MNHAADENGVLPPVISALLILHKFISLTFISQ
jgi:hypothetical protein